MSVAVFIVAERPGPDISVDGKALGHADEEVLEALCRDLGVAPLSRFLSQDPEELADYLEDAATETGDLPEEQWFSASDGLSTVRALVNRLESRPDVLARSAEILEDLREFETALSVLEAEGIRWHLQMDF